MRNLTQNGLYWWLKTRFMEISTLPQYVCHQEYIQTKDFQFVRNKSCVCVLEWDIGLWNSFLKTINANLSFTWVLCVSLSCQMHIHAWVLSNWDLTRHGAHVIELWGLGFLYLFIYFCLASRLSHLPQKKVIVYEWSMSFN